MAIYKVEKITRRHTNLELKELAQLVGQYPEKVVV